MATARGKNVVLLSSAKQGSKDEGSESFGGAKDRVLAPLALGTGAYRSSSGTNVVSSGFAPT